MRYFALLTAALVFQALPQTATGQLFVEPVASEVIDVSPDSLDATAGVPGAFMFTEPEPPRILPRHNVWNHREQLQIKDPNDPRRHIGLGEPLIGTSWLNRPNHAGWMAGGQIGAELSGATQEGGALGGLRLGCDISHYWGAEMTFAFSDLSLAGQPGENSRNFFYDLRANYYPWGDARWRPYVGTGLGMANISYTDSSNESVTDLNFLIPLAVGFKYQYKPWLAIRFEFTDFIAFGDSGVVNSISLNGGLEFRYGAINPSYGIWSL